MQRFQEGLRPWIRGQVTVFELATYTAVVQKALIIEGESERSQRDRGQGSFQDRSSRKPGFQARANLNFKRIGQGTQKAGNRFQVSNQQGIVKVSMPYCKTCGRKHTGVCIKAEVTCFKCKQKGHYSNECPTGKTTEITCYQCGRRGHIARNCKGPAMVASIPKVLALPPPPPPNQPRARTFNMTMKEAV